LALFQELIKQEHTQWCRFCNRYMILIQIQHAVQATFTATGSAGGVYVAQRVPLGAANSYTVCFPQSVALKERATTFNRIMAYNFASDGTNFTTNEYRSVAIQGYTPAVQTVAEFIAAMKNIGIPVFNNSGVLQ
jgi:hypothetical protein